MQTTETMTKYDCPPWCERPDHDVDDLSDGSPAFHYGPEFGPHIGIMALEHPLGTLNDDNRDDLTAQELRKLAADALAAAEWLEAQA